MQKYYKLLPNSLNLISLTIDFWKYFISPNKNNFISFFQIFVFHFLLYWPEQYLKKKKKKTSYPNCMILGYKLKNGPRKQKRDF